MCILKISNIYTNYCVTYGCEPYISGVNMAYWFLQPLRYLSKSVNEKVYITGEDMAYDYLVLYKHFLLKSRHNS